MKRKELGYDGTTKKYIRDRIYEHLYAPTEEQFRKRLDSLVVQNSLHYQNGQECFRYNGRVFGKSGTTPPYPKPINTLIPSLQPLMDEYLEDKAKLNNQEIPYILSYLSQALNSSENLPDYFKLFPSSIHSVLQELIDDCSCRGTHITDEQVEAITQKNMVPIELMKQRMVLNLLL